MSQSYNGPIGSGVGGIGGICGLRGIDRPVTERPQVVWVTRGLAQARLTCLGRASSGCINCSIVRRCVVVPADKPNGLIHRPPPPHCRQFAGAAHFEFFDSLCNGLISILCFDPSDRPSVRTGTVNFPVMQMLSFRRCLCWLADHRLPVFCPAPPETTPDMR